MEFRSFGCTVLSSHELSEATCLLHWGGIAMLLRGLLPSVSYSLRSKNFNALQYFVVLAEPCYPSGLSYLDLSSSLSGASVAGSDASFNSGTPLQSKYPMKMALATGKCTATAVTCFRRVARSMAKGSMAEVTRRMITHASA